MDKIVAWILIILLCVIGGSIAWNHYLNDRIAEAEAETEAAMDELQRIKGLSEHRKAELDRVKLEADRAIAKADERIAELTDKATVRDSLIVRLRAENERLQGDLLDTINLPIEEPLPPDELIKRAEQLYFPRDFGDIQLSGNPGGLEIIQVMIREIEQRRELDFNNARIITEQAEQIDNLKAVIAEHEKRYFSLETAYHSQENLIASLENETAQYDQVISGLNKQIGLLQKKITLGKGPTLAVGALVGGIYLGSKIND